MFSEKQNHVKIVQKITNNIIIVNDFGNEDVSYINQDKEFLKDCLKKLTTSAIESVVKKIYFDEDHPENHNIKMQNIRENQVIVKENNEWIRKHISGPALKMLLKGRSLLNSYYYSSDVFKKRQEEIIQSENEIIDETAEYLNKLIVPKSFDQKQALCKVKGVLSNYKT